MLDGGSLYWVIKGQIAARQKLKELRAVKRNGVPHCGLVYDKELIPVSPRPRRAFQGWRYLDDKDAPPDLSPGQGRQGPAGSAAARAGGAGAAVKPASKLP